ncbi:hypothetical protein KY284_020311 [Solanum tuberosum]|nr:hypothetical protein KY284_020311 [Solanum tuberosum]
MRPRAILPTGDGGSRGAAMGEEPGASTFLAWSGKVKRRIDFSFREEKATRCASGKKEYRVVVGEEERDVLGNRSSDRLI